MTAQLAGNGLLSILRTACMTMGLEAADAEPLPSTAYASYRLRGGGVIRIDRMGGLAAACRDVETARWLAASGIAAPQVASGIPQPIEVGGHPVTYWRPLPPHTPATPADRAVILRDLHDLTPPASLPRLAPFADLTAHIGASRTLTARDRLWVLDHLAELRDRWAAVYPDRRGAAAPEAQPREPAATVPPEQSEATAQDRVPQESGGRVAHPGRATEFPLGRPWCTVHAAAWNTAIATTADGPLLLGVPNIALGPPEWDLAPAAIECFSVGWLPGGAYRHFCDEYRADVTSWPGFYLLRDILEFRLLIHATRTATADPAMADQAQHRLACLRGDIGPRRWPGWESL